MHGLPILHDVLERLAAKYNVPIRRCEEDRAVHPFSDVFYSDFYADGVTEDYFVKLKERVQGEQTVEIMVHPAYIDRACEAFFLRNGSCEGIAYFNRE